MPPIRLGAVDYLNARPLVHGLEQRQDLFALRFDPPSKCAELLHEDSIDVGMIPAIEYCRGPEYRIVPGMAIVSARTVASVALFTTRPVARIRTVAADTSSRTSVALLRILCAERFRIAPEFKPMPPDADAMLAACDAALIIGDPALYLDPAEKGVEKIDVGEEWNAMTGLPFVWAFWAGRPDTLPPEAVQALAAARDAGVAAADQIAAAYCGPARAALGKAYLRDNIQYTLGVREIAGVLMYYQLAARHGLIGASREPLFYPSTSSGQVPSTGSGQVPSRSSAQAPATSSGQAG
ncbi:MAG TPA: menaquinone biosynthesis protein [Vicinamibacterales bacterium]|nr:menaquinone biosynthesis protein [Vicinamibacterales bacterium]